MHCFIVGSAGSNPLTEQAIQRHFPDHNYKIVPGKLWAIASELATCIDICQILGLNAESNRTGVVVKMDEYNGFFERGVWEKVNEWQVM